MPLADFLPPSPAPPTVDVETQLAQLRARAPNVAADLARLRAQTPPPAPADTPSWADQPQPAPANIPVWADAAAPASGQGIGRFLPPQTQPAPNVAEDLARLRAAQGVAAAPHDVAAGIANLPGVAQVGQAARGIGRFLSPVTSAIASAPGIAQVGQAARAIGPLAGRVLGAGPAAVERLITGGASAAAGRSFNSYDEMFTAQGVNPTGARVLGAVFRGTLDPTNLLTAPAAIARTLGTGAAVARTAEAIARSTGVAEPVARATAAATHLLTEGRFTGPIIQRTADLAAAGIERAAPLVDKYAGTPPAFRQAVGSYGGEIRTGLGAALQHQQEILDAVPAYADRVLLGQALRGVIPESRIPDRLQPAYQNIVRALRDVTTQQAQDAGILATARDNYMRRFYTPDALARIKAGATGPLPVSADVAADMPPASAAIGRVAGPSPEFRAGQIAESFSETGRRSAFGRQVEPTRGIRGLMSGFQRARTLTEDQATALGIVEDPAIALPGHEVEVAHAAANKALYDRIVGLGPGWVRPYGADTPRDWVSLQQLIGVGPAQRYGWSGLMVHPRVAQALHGVAGAGEYGMSKLLAIPTWTNNVLKRVIFLNPIVHGANQIRAAFLSQGWNILNPRYWHDVGQMVSDARDMGPVTQARLAAGGAASGGNVGRQIGNTIDEIFLRGPQAGSLRQAGLLQRVAQSRRVQDAAGPLKGPAFVRELNDQVLWNVMDAGGRNYAFQSARNQLARMAPHLSDAERDAAAARYADLVWNDYSTEHYGKLEQALNSLLFVYPWTRGRTRLFAALARSYLPSTAADVALYRQMAGRWAAANLVLPHIYRAWFDKRSAGFEAAQIPMVNPVTGQTITDDRGRPIYIKPTGWYQDAAEMLRDPAGFAFARINPGLKILGDAYAAVRDAQRQGRNVTQALLQQAAPTIADVYPAGLGQAMRPGIPLTARVLPSLGVPVTAPPPSENPRMQMQTLIDQGRYFEAGQLAKQSGFGTTFTLPTVPAPGRREFLRGYAHRGGGLPGLSMPALPRLR